MNGMSRLKPDEFQTEHSERHVYILSYVRPRADGTWTGMSIGVYSSLDEVEKAKDRLSKRPGYREYPAGFQVYGRVLNVEYDRPDFFANFGPLPSNTDEDPDKPVP